MTVAAVTTPRPVTPSTILAATLAQLSARLDATDAVDDGLRAELRRAAQLAGGLDPYLSRCTTPESEALAGLARRTQAEDWGRRAAGSPGAPLEQEMLSGHVEGQLLQFLVHVTRAERVLEIGMFTGYSALAMAEALGEGGRVVACELDDYVADVARECFAASPDGHRITVEVGPATQTLGRLSAAGETFDLVFVDADKAGYAGYLDALLDTDLLAPGGLVCVDNTLMQGEPYLPGEQSANGRAIADFNERVAADPRVAQVLLPLRDGFTLIRRA